MGYKRQTRVKISIKFFTSINFLNELLFTEMDKTTGEAGLRIKIKFDMPNTHPSKNMDKGVKFRAKFVLEVKL